MSASPPSATSDDVLEIAARIRRYCADHPQAADTLAGVHRWWLGASLPDACLEDVEVALLSLVDEGVIQRRAIGDGTVLYFSRGARGRP